MVAAVEQYLNYIETRYSGSASERSHADGMTSCLIELYENERAAAIGPRELRAVRNVMIKKRGWSRSYVNDQVGRLKRMYKWLVGEGLVPVSVYQTLCVVEGLREGEEGVRETDPVQPVEDSVIEATLPHLPEVVANMVRVQ